MYFNSKDKSSFLRFLLIGSINTGIDFIIYMVLSLLINITISKVISMLCASIVSYLLNKNWTFQNKNKTNWKYITKFYATFLVNLSINVSVNRIVYSIYGIKVIAFVIATGCAMIINYLLQKVWVFKIIQKRGGVSL